MFFITLLLLSAALGLLYMFLTWHFGHWKKLGIKEGKTIPFVGSFPSIYTQKQNMCYDANELYNKYKKTDDFVGVYLTRMPALLILSPELARKVLVSDFKHFHDNEFSNFINSEQDTIFAENPFVLRGEAWKERRAEITPGITISRIKQSFGTTQTVCRDLVAYLHKQAKMAPREGFDFKEIALRFTTEVVTDCVLGLKAGSFTDKPTPIFAHTQKFLQSTTVFVTYVLMATLLPVISRFYQPTFFSKDATNFFCDLMRRSIDLRQQSTEHKDRADFLNYILKLREKKQLTVEQVTSNCMTFLVDGFETTAISLAYTFLGLARNPDAQNKLLAEIRACDEDITFEKLHELPYLDACVHESLRAYPIQLISRKLCTMPYEFVNKDGTRLNVEPGTVIMVPAYSYHLDADYYKNPEEYRPERFLVENGGLKKYRDMGVFLGFGDGPRACFGMRFALTQMKAAIVAIVNDFVVKVNPRTRTDNFLDESNFLGSLKGGIFLDLEPRN